MNDESDTTAEEFDAMWESAKPVILWRPYGSGVLGSSAYIKHCQYEIRPLGTGQQEVRQYWTGKSSRILLKACRAKGLEEAKSQANQWDATHEPAGAVK